MSIFNLATLSAAVRRAFSAEHRGLYGAPKKKPMSEAIAEKFMWEVMTSSKWDHLFHSSGFSEEGLRFGPVDESMGLKSVFSLNKFPRLLSPNFIVREVCWRKEVMPGHQEIRFCGKDRNDSITVHLEGMGEFWKPVGLQVIFLNDARTDDTALITDYMPVLEG